MSKGYGFSKFISSGNQASLNVSDYLEYLAQDEATKAIVLYIEGVQEGRRFFEIAKEVVKRKPIVVYKGGRTAAGSRATLSHTASLAGSDEVFDAACKQAGIIRCYEVIHPFDLAEALAYQPLPKGKRVTVIGSGGQCVATADACAELGLELPEFDEDTKRRITEILAPHAPVPTNPIDTAATPYPMTVPRILEIVASLDYIDGIITSGGFAAWDMTPDRIRNLLAEAEALTSIPQRFGKPLITTTMRWHASDIALDLYRRAGIPYYTTPEESARAMHGLMKYGEIRRQIGESK
jgi:acyl-CoA synthetase (NDP forming)